ncbi:MAG TPA: hypothetical protein PKM61_07930, partial [bacterium]|nr:hypothetical protein [bacterium]
SGSRQEETGIIESHRQFIDREFSGEKARAEYGRGRVAYLPRIDYLFHPHAFQSRYHVFYDGIDSRYWKEPLNRDEILAELEWLYPDCRPLRVAEAPELRLDYLAWPDGRLGAALLRCGTLAGPADLRLGVRAAAAPLDGELWRPGDERPLKLAWRREKDYFETGLAGVGRHGVVRWRLKE